MAGEKTEKASPRQKQKARERGDMVHSRELTSAIGMGAGVLAIGTMTERFAVGWRTAYMQALDLGSHRDMSLHDGAVVNDLVRASLLHTVVPVAIVLAAILAVALIVGMAQSGGVQIHGESMQLNFERLSPAANLKNVFSLRASARLFKSLIPATLVMALGADILEHTVLSLPVLSLEQLPLLFQSQYRLLLATSGILLCWSALDYVVEWRSWEQRLRMSREDMRQEYKEMEGNPQIRSRIRSIQRQMRRRKLQADVSRASVVITNPTHYAIALEFNFDTLQTPKVLAKGRNLMAERIKDQARWAAVPIIENPPLARSLYRAVEPGESIPHDLYAAVASILAFLYRQRVEEKMRGNARQQKKSQEQARPHRPYAVSALRLGPGIENSMETTEHFGTTNAGDSSADTTESAAQASPQEDPSTKGQAGEEAGEGA
ncbi:MAG TPA: EscU/YscU/HrcU family type III secretion system export apparatus switch protein [Acidobacteriaceae bacterium]|nr:EscU/YscU/HrcU family type III secretion system export apparatus switch protein [Acidobacteriaceae bacterium]